MRTATLILVSMLCGCSMGPNPNKYAPAKSAGGAEGTIHAKDTAYKGELIGIRDDGFILKYANGLVHIPHTAIRSVNFSPIASTAFGSGGITTKFVERLRLVSRFPQGVNDELLARLLAHEKQATLEQAVTR